ncbi:MAG: hypothetical protein EA384_06880 [Spirochaetaceae bacterium]|nr:MAG: hypothetical protein EA384_06880 [Spirochaetaceae bacterium]
MSTEQNTAVESEAAAARLHIPPGSPFVAKVLHSSETELCSNPHDFALGEGDLVVIPTKYGKDLAEVLGPVSESNASVWKNAQPVDRVATDTDLARYRENLRREAQAFDSCRRKIASRRLDMKLVAAHYILDEPKLLFFFTADGRVDFRELVKDLVSEFRIRIELRQIGVRDESRVLGGIGVCGRTLCCHGLTDKLCPVSIKMAKVQNLSLNSMKISGPCGRLLCCLYYEHDFYVGEKQRFPDEGTRIPYDETVFRVTEVNIISRQIRLSGEDGRYLSLPICRFERDPRSRRWRILDGLPCPGSDPAPTE